MVAYTRWGCIWSGGNRGLMNGIMRQEWGSNGLTITDNVLTTYVNGVDGVMAGGVSTFDAMMPYVTRQLPKFKNDPVIVNAMREACHHNLYAIANSVGMNGVGANTTVTATKPTLLFILQIIACGCTFFFLLSLVLYIIKKVKFTKSQEYIDYKQWKSNQR